MQRVAASRFLPRILAAVESCNVKTITTTYNTPLMFTGLRSVVECQHRFAPISSVISRSFSNSGAPLSSTLSNILLKEIDYEKQNYSQPEELAGGPPSPFTLTETRGDSLMTLTRQFGHETIHVDVSVNEQPEEEPFETEDGAIDVDVGILFTVQVTKNEDSLVFECKSDGSYVTITHVSFEPVDEELSESAYTGPVYEELDEDLQAQFTSYLEERGINAEFGAYVLRLVHDKEQREYMYWLERTAKFIQS